MLVLLDRNRIIDQFCKINYALFAPNFIDHRDLKAYKLTCMAMYIILSECCHK